MTVPAIHKHIRILKNSELKGRSIPNGLYWEVHKLLHSHEFIKMTAPDILRELFDNNYRLPALMKDGKYSQRLIAHAIVHVFGERPKQEASEVTGSATALFQAQMNSTRDNDVEAEKVRADVRKCELWGNEPDPETRAKMTGGRSYPTSETQRANDLQVGGDHYQRQAIQHWDYVIANGIPYLEAQIIKYVSRWQDKNGLEDLLKAKHFLEKLIEVNSCTAAKSAKPAENNCECSAQCADHQDQRTMSQR